VKARFDVEPIEQGRDLFSAAVNEDKFEPATIDLRDLREHRAAQPVVNQKAAAEFNDDSTH
jgi:hypothetical protein